MVPIHDTDLAEDRWSKGEWSSYELWEKVELRFKRQRRLWIAGTVALFLTLSAVPIVVDRWPKWTTRALARHLALEINQVKRQASSDRSAYRLEFVGSLQFQVKKVDSCTSDLPGVVVKDGSLSQSLPAYFNRKVTEQGYTLVSPQEGQRLSIPGLLSSFCYDPLLGSSLALKSDEVSGFGFIYAKDLTDDRMDRVSILLLAGPSAEISFD